MGTAYRVKDCLILLTAGNLTLSLFLTIGIAASGVGKQPEDKGLMRCVTVMMGEADYSETSVTI
jgi:hypothetical protein